MQLNTVFITHSFLQNHIKKGSLCIDATAGNGHDSVFMALLAGENGKVLAFDVQDAAIQNTTAAVCKANCGKIVTVIKDSHSNMAAYASPETVDAIAFNLGWLPGGDHNIFTQWQTSIRAINAALQLLKPGGVISLAIYYGKQCGYIERDEVLKFLSQLDDKKYTVIVSQFYNRKNDPAIPVFIIKE